MIPIVLGIVIWFPPVLGFGFLAWVWLARLTSQTFQEGQVLYVALPGLGVLSLIANLLNFFLPLTPYVNLAVLLAGWLCFFILIPRFNFQQFRSPAFLIFAAIILICIAVSAGKAMFNYESGWYHLQSIRWLTDSRVPFGLANIYGLYTYNSSWFSLHAIIEIPFMEGQSAFVLNPLLAFIYGLDIGLMVMRLRDVQKLTFSSVFTLFTIIVWVEQLMGYNLNSASADMAIVFSSLLLITLCIRVTEKPEQQNTYYFLAVFIAAFALTIKLSSFPLLLAPAFLLLFQLGRPVWPMLQKRINSYILPSLGIAAVFLIPWFIRSLILSGCLVYPVQFTCFTGLPWAASPNVVTNDMNAIRYWARNAWGDPSIALEGWGWLSGWLQKIVTPNVIAVTVLLLVLSGLIYFVATRKNSPRAGNSVQLGLPMMMAVCGLTLWFLSAPDPRFGEGYAWSIVLLPLAFSVYHFCIAYQLRNLSRPLAVAGLIIAVLFVLLAPAALPAPWPFSVPWLKNNEALQQKGLALLTRWPSIPEPQLRGTYIDETLTLFTPVYREQCWDASVICTPEIYPGLTAYYDSSGHPYMFTLQPVAAP